jgi:hypothetical protein
LVSHQLLRVGRQVEEPLCLRLQFRKRITGKILDLTEVDGGELLPAEGGERSPVLLWTSMSAKRRNVMARWAVRSCTVQGMHRVGRDCTPGGPTALR